MNGCDSYPGAQGGALTTTCRASTPEGPQPVYADLYRRYSCVVHGGRHQVGQTHEQMDDTHVLFPDLENTGLLWVFLYVSWGLISDPSSPYYPAGNYYGGNPAGAQEWKKGNYCACSDSCKVRKGNIGGQIVDPGNPCPKTCPHDPAYLGDNFFWAREP